MSQKFLPVEKQLKVITRGTVDLIPLEELKTKLKASYKNGKPLRIKQGFDPTAPDIHLGHTVGIRKLQQFQELGHQDGQDSVAQGGRGQGGPSRSADQNGGLCG